MGDFLEALRRASANTLRGRIGSEQFGMGSFESLELIHEGVVFCVGDGGAVFDVVEILVMAEEGLQFSDLCRWIIIGGGSRTTHGQDYSF
jgi:hypothetical protein